MRPATRLTELSAERFQAHLPGLIQLYAAAMNPPPMLLPARRSIMESHAGNAGFRAVVATIPPAAPEAGGQAIGFAYGFRGAPGQWWHDVVREAITAREGPLAASRWLADSVEVAEVHVHPAHQGHGTGRELLLRLVAGRPERTAVLSTMDADTPARRLYLGLGFTEVLSHFMFPGANLAYAIMGTTLPLPETQRAAETGPPPAARWDRPSR